MSDHDHDHDEHDHDGEGENDGEEGEKEKDVEMSGPSELFTCDEFKKIAGVAALLRDAEAAGVGNTPSLLTLASASPVVRDTVRYTTKTGLSATNVLVVLHAFCAATSSVHDRARAGVEVVRGCAYTGADARGETTVARAFLASVPATADLVKLHRAARAIEYADARTAIALFLCRVAANSPFGDLRDSHVDAVRKETSDCADFELHERRALERLRLRLTS